jgi:hypothetical protein
VASVELPELDCTLDGPVELPEAELEPTVEEDEEDEEDVEDAEEAWIWLQA